MRVRLRGSLLRDVRSGAKFGSIHSEIAPNTNPEPPGGPEDTRAGSIGGAHFYEVRNVIQIPFDDSIDGTYPLECFFQMPVGTLKISKAQVWVQRKPFRMYASASSSSSTSTSSSASGAHNHANSSGSQATGPGPDGHTHSESTWPLAQTENSGNGHTHSISTSTTTTTTLTPGIFESGPSGNVSLYVADDGATYGALVSGPSTALTAVDITTQLTKTTGDKRIKITATGLMRVQVLLVLDLLVAVDPLQIGIP